METNFGNNTIKPGMLTAVFNNRSDFERAYDAISRRGYSKDDITVVMLDETRNKHFTTTSSSDYSTSNSDLSDTSRPTYVDPTRNITGTSSTDFTGTTYTASGQDYVSGDRNNDRSFGDKVRDTFDFDNDNDRSSARSDASDRKDAGDHSMEGAGVGSAIGGTLGAVAGAIAAIGTAIALPGLGLVIAGPIAAGLAGAGAGGLTGGVLGALVGSGVPEDNAKNYEKSLSEGGILLGVKPRSEDDAREIERELRNFNGEHIYY